MSWRRQEAEWIEHARNLNKLKKELDSFGIPPKFPEDDPEVRAKMEAEMAAAAAAKAAAEVTKFFTLAELQSGSVEDSIDPTKREVTSMP